VEKRMKVGAGEEVELWGEEVEIEREMVRERREKGLGAAGDPSVTRSTSGSEV
jgi:hypothetical protein